MKRLLKWSLYLLASFVLILLVLLAPVAYVETACHGNGDPKPYEAILASNHHRPESRTLMTYPEWHIVHAYEDYAKVIKTGDPHEYGFVKSIAGFWSSLCSLSKASATIGEIDTETKQMVYVIGVSFSAELALKALYEETVGRIFAFLRGPEHSKVDKLSAQHATNYANFLQQVPWYKWRFRDDARELDAVEAGKLRDHERNFALGLEYKAKAAYADIIAQAVAATGVDQLTLRMIVANVESSEVTPYPDVKFIAKVPNGVVIETPRYRALTKLLEAMANDGLDFIEIAGNDEILFSVISENETHSRAIASMSRQGFNDYRHLLLVQVSELADQLRTLRTSEAQLEHIHDY